MDFLHLLNARDRLCSLCSWPLSRIAVAAGTRVCESRTCRDALFHAQNSARCPICQLPLTINRGQDGLCQYVECRMAAQQKQAQMRANEAIQRRRHLIDTVAPETRNQMALSAGISDPESVPVGIVPRFRQTLVDVPEARRKAFLKHVHSVVEQVIDESGRMPESSTPEPGGSERVLTAQYAGCALCQGRCCRNGREHAYLNKETMRRIRRDHPEKNMDQFLEMYLERLPAESVEGSCLFHGQAGCVLPRGIRSNICNEFLCTDIKLIGKTVQNSDADTIFIASVKRDAVVDSCFVSLPTVE